MTTTTTTATITTARSQTPTGYRKPPAPLHTGDNVIGLALGSPREQPLPPTPHDDADWFYTLSLSPETSSLAPAPLKVTRNKTPPKAYKPRSQKWKGIGQLFGRKSSSVDEGQPIFSLQQDPAYEGSRFGPIPQCPEDLSLPSIRQQPPRAISVPKNETIRPTTANQHNESRGLLRRVSSRRKGPSRRNVEEMRTARPRAMTAPSVAGPMAPPPSSRIEKMRLPHKPSAGPRLLQVEIPNVEMERYSIMFKDLLQPSQGKPLPSIRRQERDLPKSPNTPPETPEKPPAMTMETIRPKSARKNSKDSTSSAGSKAPSFSLFPNTAVVSNRNAINKPLPKPSPLSRSVTTPDVTVPVPRPSIQASQSEEPNGLMILLRQQDHADNFEHYRMKSSHRRQGSSLKMSVSSDGSRPTGSVDSTRSLLPAASIHGSQKQDEDALVVAVKSSQSSFPTRSSSLKSLKASSRRVEIPSDSNFAFFVDSHGKVDAGSNIQVDEEQTSPLPQPPPFHTPRPTGTQFPASNKSSLSSTTASDSFEPQPVISIARQISVSRREKSEVEVVIATSNPSSMTSSSTQMSYSRKEETAPFQQQQQQQSRTMTNQPPPSRPLLVHSASSNAQRFPHHSPSSSLSKSSTNTKTFSSSSSSKPPNNTTTITTKTRSSSTPPRPPPSSSSSSSPPTPTPTPMPTTIPITIPIPIPLPLQIPLPIPPSIKLPPSPQPETQRVLARQTVRVDRVGDRCGGEEATRKSHWGIVEGA